MTRTMKGAGVALLTLAAAVGVASRPSIHAQAVVPGAGLIEILQTELQRNITALRAQATPAYFIGYTVADERATQIMAANGALERSDDSRGRFATVEVRVGDYALDNTHPIRGEQAATSPRVGRSSLPLTNDAAPIELALWRATDGAYRTATAALTRVQTNVAAKIQQEDAPPDFSREEPQTFAGEPVEYSIDIPQWEARLRRISVPFASDPLIFASGVSLTIQSTNRYYTNSEGTRLATGELQFRIFISGVTKAADGMELPLYNSYFSRSLDGLPSEARLLADAKEMVSMLGRLRQAPIVEPYSGPAILSGRAAGVFFHEIFGHRAEGHRQRNADDGQTFGSKVNELILPTFMSVTFDPTVRTRGTTELMGHYLYDDEGVRARRVPIVEQGILKTFLLGRAPLAAFPRSNGHGRAEAGFVPVSRQSNLIVEASRTVSSAQLVTMLKDEARRQGKPFGLLFENIEGGFTTTGRNNPNAFNVMPNLVWRIYTDNRPPELVRGVDLIGTPLAAFGRFVAASDTVDVFNGVCGAESGSVPVSASSPELLVSEVEVQKKAVSQEAMPILAAPPLRRPGGTN